MGKEEFLKEIRRQISAEQLKLNKRLTAFATAKQSGNVEAISVAEEHVNVSTYFVLNFFNFNVCYCIVTS